MNEIQEKWVEALRSGKYLQGKGFLRMRSRGSSTDSFCCLGVLCELAVEAGVIPPGTLTESNKGDVFLYEGNSDSFLPVQVGEWAGLVTTGMEIEIKPLYTSRLIDLNDNGTSFAEIANIIEINASTLFVPEPDHAD